MSDTAPAAPRQSRLYQFLLNLITSGTLDDYNTSDRNHIVFLNTVSFAGVSAKYVKLTVNSTWGGISGVTGLAEVRFYSIPVQARAPQPAAAATGVAIDTTLTWRPGREAGSHKVYFGTDQAAALPNAALTRSGRWTRS